jgi:zinc transport system substrate-binding protein
MILMKISPVTRVRSAAGFALAAPLLLAGCGGSLGGGEAGSRVVASFYPLEYVAERVAGDHLEVATLTSPGVEPHDLELTVRQTAEVSEADLVVYEKGLQPAVDAAVEEHGPEQVVEATEVVELEPAEAEEHAGESEEEHAEHAEAEGDLHFWLDPVRLAEVAAAVEARLAEIDPENAADYEANLEDLRADLEAVDREYEQGLTDCRLDTVVVSHDAFGYLEKYGLHFESIAGLSPDAEPSPAHLTELAGLIEDEQVTTVFSETLASPAMAQTLARDLGLETAVLDPIEGLGDATADEDYLSLMRSNLDALRTANGCR